MIIWPTYKCCKMCSRQYTNTECVATEGNWKIAYQSFHRSSEANDENDSVCIDMLFFFHAIYFAFFRQKMVLYEKGKMMVKKLANGEGKYSKDDTECCFIGEIPSTGLVDVTNAVMTRLRNMRAAAGAKNSAEIAKLFSGCTGCAKHKMALHNRDQVHVFTYF